MSSGRKISNRGRAGWQLLGAAALAAAIVLPRGAEAITEQVLYTFCQRPNCADGFGPTAGLIIDAAGNLYGTASYGGAFNAGVVFELAPDGTETVLYSFCSQPGCADGLYPRAGLVMDGAGNLYGTTAGGGAFNAGVYSSSPRTGLKPSFTASARGATKAGAPMAASPEPA